MAQPIMVTRDFRVVYIGELIIGAAAPALIALGILPGIAAFPLLLAGVIYAAILIKRHKPSGSELGFGPGRRPYLGRAIRVGIAIWMTAVLFAIIYCHLIARNAFPLLWQRPLFLLVIAIIYPFSVSAQIFLFFSFFHWRYKSLLSGRRLIFLNIVIFAWIHIVYGSWVSVGLAALGGIFFAGLYAQYRNFWALLLFHWMVGTTVFAMGFGHYFYRPHPMLHLIWQ